MVSWDDLGKADLRGAAAGVAGGRDEAGDFCGVATSGFGVSGAGAAGASAGAGGFASG